MKWLRGRVIVASLASIALVQDVAAAPSADDPADVTQALYAKAVKNEGYDMEILKGYRRWMTPGFYAVLMKEESKPVAKGDASDLDFDVILGAQDVPDKYKVGHASIDHDTAQVPVTTYYGGGTERHVLTITLKQIDGAWKVDDINYGNDKNGLTGSIRTMIKNE